MKIDVATMRTDRSAKIDTDSVQTAHRLYSHTSTEATETTDKAPPLRRAWMRSSRCF